MQQLVSPSVFPFLKILNSQVKDLQAEAKSCSLKVKSITVDETQEAFCLDQKTQERYYSEDINKLACPTKGEGFNK